VKSPHAACSIHSLCETAVCRSLRFPRRHQLTVEKVVPARFTFKGLIRHLDEKKWESNQVIVERGGQTVLMNAGELFTARVGIPVASERPGRVNL